MKRTHERLHQAPALTRLAGLMATASCAGLLGMPAHAQTAPAAPEAAASAAEAPRPEPAKAEAKSSDVVGLERIVITATSTLKSKMRSSVSVTDIDNEQIQNLGARSEAEVLLLIPGIRTEPTAGPGGNSNISVRGLPISSGGSKYVQLQEDGLPTVQFGDMNFSNNDYWIRFDNNVDSIQTLRGGNSAVFASQAPGAVLNYISKTGRTKGGSFGLTKGVNYNETRVDGDIGDRIAPDLYFHVGGYYREGQGARKTTPNTLLGYQLKGNVTKEFNGGKGYFRLNFKLLDEHAPTTPQTFINATQNGNKISGFSLTPGYDAQRDSQYSIYNSSVPGIDPVTHQQTSNSLTDGIQVNSRSLGFEFHNELAGGWQLDDRFRLSKNSGAFQAQFWSPGTLAFTQSQFGAGTTFKYFNGPQAGQTVTAANLGTGLISQSAAINTQTPDMGILVNDLSVGKGFALDIGKLDLRGGLFHSRQNVVQRWAISERLVQAAKDGAVIDAFDATGAALTTAGLTGYNNQWGGCCARDVDTNFTTNAPYLSLNLESGPVDLDAGVRRETFSAAGNYIGGSARAFDVNGDGTISGAEKHVYLIDGNTPRGLVNYSINYTNYSLGGNYRINNDLSAFARTSKGYRAIADRLLFSANIDAATGALTNPTSALAPVKQSEVGLKFRGKAESVNYGLFATYFHSSNTEFDYDQTRQDNPNLPNYQGPKLNVIGYKANGLELETAASLGDFSLNVNIVYSKSEVTTNLGQPSVIGKTEAGVPKVRFTISPRYTIGPATLGATVRGRSSVYIDGGNTTTIDGYYVVGGFVNYDFGNGVIGALNVNNLFNKLAVTGSGGFVNGSSSIFGAGIENGRTISASLRYAF